MPSTDSVHIPAAMRGAKVAPRPSKDGRPKPIFVDASKNARSKKYGIKQEKRK